MSRDAIRTVLLCGLMVLGVHSAQTLHAIAATLDVLAPDTTRRIALNMGSQITFTKTLPDGTTATLTVTQQDGESFEDFVARARREYEAWCEVIG